jgi:hypothetical protein
MYLATLHPCQKALVAHRFQMGAGDRKVAGDFSVKFLLDFLLKRI